MGDALHLPLHSSDETLSLRHNVSWWMFSGAAGAVNSGAFIATERFVSHLTGTVTAAGLEAVALDAFILIAAFIFGAMASALMLNLPALRGERPKYWVPLFLVAAIVAAVGVVGELGVFGGFGGEVDSVADMVMLAVLAFSMGLLNASVASSTAHSVRTTHVTGPATDFGVHLVTALVAPDEAQRRRAAALAFLRGSNLAAFGLGAGAMAFPMAWAGYSAFLLPAAMVMIGTWRSFREASAQARQLVTPIA